MINRINKILLIYILALCTGCEVNTNELIYKQQSVVKLYHDCSSADSNCTSIVFSYPVIEYSLNEKTETKLNNIIATHLLSSVLYDSVFYNIDELADHFLDDYEMHKNNFPEYNIPWYLKNDIRIIYLSHKIISMQCTIFSFTGGAHPNTITGYASYSLVTGKKLDLDSILISSRYNDFVTYAEKKFRIAQSIDDSLSLNDKGFWFGNNEFYLPDNYAFTESGFVFHFNAYEIAPYSTGPIELKLTLHELKPFLKENLHY